MDECFNLKSKNLDGQNLRFVLKKNYMRVVLLYL